MKRQLSGAIVNRNLTLVLLVIQAAIFMVTRNDPFFGDSISTVARASVHMYNQGLHTLWYLPADDPGHPTLFPYLLATAWTLFGQKLVVGHIFTLVFSILLLHRLRIFSRFFMPANWDNLPGLLLTCCAVFLAQSALVLTHLPLTWLFIWAMQVVLQQRWKIFAWVTAGMMLLHLEAAFLLVALLLADMVLNTSWKQQPLRWILSRWFAYGLPLLVLGIWAYAHYRHTGWIFSSPNYAAHRQQAGIMQFAYNLAICAWRMTDYGLLALWLPLLLMARKALKLQSVQLLLITTGVLTLFISYWLSNSIGHRYFMPVMVLLAVAVCSALYRYKFRTAVWWLPVLMVVLLAGNFLVYPGKVVGDATLAYRNYFPLLQKLDQELPPGTRVYSYAPTATDTRITHLDRPPRNIHLTSLYDAGMDTVSYVMQSSFNADFSAARLKQLEQWPCNGWQQGSIWLTIYRNPALGPAPSHWKPRGKSAAEDWITRLKQQLKPQQ